MQQVYLTYQLDTDSCIRTLFAYYYCTLIAFGKYFRKNTGKDQQVQQQGVNLRWMSAMSRDTNLSVLYM